MGAMSSTANRKVCIVATSPFAVRAFLTGHVKALSERYSVTVICNMAESAIPLEFGDDVRLLSIRIERGIDLWRDFVALITLFRLFRSEGFDVVHSATPKAGLLAQLAACMAGIPCRIHVFTGQVWLTKRGLRRFALRLIDRFYAACATHVLVDSASQRDFLVAEHVLPADKGDVLGKGSISGVDVRRFVPDGQARLDIRAQHGIPSSALVFLYLGRLTRDKGVLDLASAFSDHANRHPSSWLLIVGPDEEGLVGTILQLCGSMADRVRVVGYTAKPESFMAASDVLCLPSYREGFGSVILEAGACGIPALGSRIYGITDAIVEGKTGLLHEPADKNGIIGLLDRMAQEVAFRRALGEAARERVIRDFSAETVTTALMKYYEIKSVRSNSHHSCGSPPT